jgi:hypothetical protein
MEPEIRNTLCDTLGNSSTLVIFAVLLLVSFAIFRFPPEIAEKIVSNSLAGLFGIAVGKSLK